MHWKFKYLIKLNMQGNTWSLLSPFSNQPARVLPHSAHLVSLSWQDANQTVTFLPITGARGAHFIYRFFLSR